METVFRPSLRTLGPANPLRPFFKGDPWNLGNAADDFVVWLLQCGIFGLCSGVDIDPETAAPSGADIVVVNTKENPRSSQLLRG